MCGYSNSRCVRSRQCTKISCNPGAMSCANCPRTIMLVHHLSRSRHDLEVHTTRCSRRYREWITTLVHRIELRDCDYGVSTHRCFCLVYIPMSVRVFRHSILHSDVRYKSCLCGTNLSSKDRVYRRSLKIDTTIIKRCTAWNVDSRGFIWNSTER